MSCETRHLRNWEQRHCFCGDNARAMIEGAPCCEDCIEDRGWFICLDCGHIDRIDNAGREEMVGKTKHWLCKPCAALPVGL